VKSILLLSVLTITSAQIIDRNVRPSGRVDRQTDHNYQREGADTLAHNCAWVLWRFLPGEAALLVWPMPVDGRITGVRVPVADWGNGDPELTISLHQVSYPYRADSLVYSNTTVDGNGWIGGYDMDSTGRMSIMGTDYSPGSTVGICDTSDTVATGAHDPLGLTAALSGPVGTPHMGLIWPDSSVAAVINPANSPPVNDNSWWINTATYGTEPEFSGGEYVGILVRNTSDTSGVDQQIAFLYGDAEIMGLTNPWPMLKFYRDCEGTSGNGGWHIRFAYFCFDLALHLTGDRGPSFEDITILPTTISTSPRTVIAEVYDHYPIDGLWGVDSVEVYYSVDGGVYTAVPLIDSGNNLYTGQIPGQSRGSQVEYYYRAIDIESYVTESQHYTYQIFQPLVSNLFFYNSSLFPAWIQDYYLAETGLQADYWDYGVGSPELFDYYDIVIEMTGDGPNWINSDSIRPWLEDGGNYILAGDEWLGAQTVWQDSTYSPGSFQYDILGIAADHNDISGGGGVSRLLTVANDSISGEMHAFLDDSLDMNYDPSFTNWLDGVTPAPGVNVAFYGLSGQIDSLNNPAADADTFAVGIYRTLPGGSKVVFFTFDPLATNTTPNHQWIGVEPFGPLQAAIGWVLGTTATNETPLVPLQLTLNQNYPNPFNPVTTIHYELPERTDIRMTIYDLLGREVAVLEDGVQGPGLKEVQWDATNVASGIYFYRLQTGSKTITRKMVLLK